MNNLEHHSSLRVFSFFIFPLTIAAYIVFMVFFEEQTEHTITRLLLIALGAMQIVSGLTGVNNRVIMSVVGLCYLFVGILTLALGNTTEFIIVRVSFVTIYVVPLMVVAAIFIYRGVILHLREVKSLLLILGGILTVICISNIPAMFNDTVIRLLAAAHLIVTTLAFSELNRQRDLR